MSARTCLISALAGGLATLAGLSYFSSPAFTNSVVTSAVAATKAPPTVAHAAPAGDLKANLRRLFEDRAVYTRNTIVSALGDGADIDAITARLLRNQDEIANALKPYWGDDRTKTLAVALKDQINAAIAAIRAARTGDKGKLGAAGKKWSDNSSALAIALVAANPNWQKTSLEQALQKQVDLTMREVTARLLRDWNADVKAYDDTEQQVLAFADMLSDGVVRQFPERFSG